MLTALEKCAEGKRIVLLLHDFDAILNNPQIDPKYGVEFFNHLNALRNQGNRLVCITESPHSQAQVFVDQKVHGNSWLDLKKLDLPPLSTVELKNELLGSDLNLDERQINCIVDAVKQEPQAYALLEFILTKIRQDDSAGLKFNKRLKKWVKALVFFRGMKSLQKAAFSSTYKTVWCAGPSIEHVHAIRSVSDIVNDLKTEYAAN